MKPEDKPIISLLGLYIDQRILNLSHTLHSQIHFLINEDNNRYQLKIDYKNHSLEHSIDIETFKNDPTNTNLIQEPIDTIISSLTEFANNVDILTATRNIELQNNPFETSLDKPNAASRFSTQQVALQATYPNPNTFL